MEDAAIEDRVAPGPQFNIEAGEGKKRRERFWMRLCGRRMWSVSLE